MKKIYSTLLLVALFFVVACKKDAEPPTFSVDKNEIKLTGLAGVSDSLTITGNVDWTITVAPAASWLQVDKLTGSGAATIYLKNTTPNGASPVEVVLTITPTDLQVAPIIIKVVQLPFFNLHYSKLLHEDDSDSFRSGVATADGGFIMVGLTMKAIATGTDWMQNGLIAKYNATGQLLWKKVLGGAEYDAFKRVIATTDGYYVAMGDARYILANNQRSPLNFWAVKFDANGTVLWNKTYGGDSDDYGYGAAALPNGAILLAGTSIISTDGTSAPLSKWITRASVLQIDAQGILQSTKLISDPAWYYNLQAMEPTKDGNFILSGLRGIVNDSLSREAYLLKMTPTATVLWQKTYPGYCNDDNGALVVAADGGYCLGNRLLSQDKQHFDARLIKTDANGNKTWEKIIGASGHEETAGLAEVPGGGYYWAINKAPLSNTVTAYYEGLDVELFRLDAHGNKLWSKTIAGSKYDAVYGMLRTSDNKFVTSGATESADGFFTGVQGRRDAWFMKFE